MWVRSFDWKDPLEYEMATHSSILTWRILKTEEPGWLQSMGSHRIRHDWSDLTWILYVILLPTIRWTNKQQNTQLIMQIILTSNIYWLFNYSLGNTLLTCINLLKCHNSIMCWAALCSVAQSCLTLLQSIGCSLPVSSVLWIFLARILEWVAISYSRRSSQSRDWTRVSYVSCIGM